jgi:hypothetical protein
MQTGATPYVYHMLLYVYTKGFPLPTLMQAQDPACGPVQGNPVPVGALFRSHCEPPSSSFPINLFHFSNIFFSRSERIGTTARSILESLWAPLGTQILPSAIQQVPPVTVADRSHSRLVRRRVELVRDISSHHASPLLTSNIQQDPVKDYIRKLNHPRLTNTLTPATPPQWVG